ncbi:MAG: substrate-binding domain-containing protein [Saccharofermentans sp.]|nr:substrate-binding domain-containing protein [Saccharofermentans sp.]
MKRRISKNYIFFSLYVVLVLLTAFIGIRFVSVYFSDGSNQANQEIYDKYYVVISDDNQSSFWKSVYEGAYNYGLENNVYVEDLATGFSGDLSKEELMRIAIASNVDGILVSADDSKEMTALIDEAASKGIPVVTLYNDAPNSKRISYVGVGSYNIGTEYGRQALSVAKSIYAENPDEQINVVVLVDSVPSTDQMMVYSTLQESFEKDALSFRLNLDMVKIDTTNTFSVEENIRDVFLSEDVPDIIICLSELDTTCVYQAVVDYNQVGKVNILGYHDSVTILQGIERGIINSSIRIDTQQMGEYSVNALLEYDRAGFTNQYFTVDIDVINSYTVSAYMEDSANGK